VFCATANEISFMQLWMKASFQIHANVSCDGIFGKLIIAHSQYDKKVPLRTLYKHNKSYFGDNSKWKDRQWEFLFKESLLLPKTWVCTWRNVWHGIRHDWYVSNSIFVQSVLSLYLICFLLKNWKRTFFSLTPNIGLHFQTKNRK